MINVLLAIEKLQKEKTDNRIVPNHILEVELFAEINRLARSELNELFKDDKIIVCETINQKAISIK